MPRSQQGIDRLATQHQPRTVGKGLNAFWNLKERSAKAQAVHRSMTQQAGIADMDPAGGAEALTHSGGARNVIMMGMGKNHANRSPAQFLELLDDTFRAVSRIDNYDLPGGAVLDQITVFEPAAGDKGRNGEWISQNVFR